MDNRSSFDPIHTERGRCKGRMFASRFRSNETRGLSAGLFIAKSAIIESVYQGTNQAIEWNNVFVVQTH